MPEATLRKFGWPASVIAETAHWNVLLRPQQPTLGALVLVCTQPVTAFGDVDAAGHADLGRVVSAVERMLAAAVGYEKINYLMLMMVDPDVHFHVLPRYAGTRSFAGIELPDTGWPGPPALASGVTLDGGQSDALVSHLRAHWAA